MMVGAWLGLQTGLFICLALQSDHSKTPGKKLSGFFSFVPSLSSLLKIILIYASSLLAFMSPNVTPATVYWSSQSQKANPDLR